MTRAGWSAVGALTALLALAGPAGAQAPLVTVEPAVVSTTSAPEPLWVPDPEPVAETAHEAEPAADVAPPDAAGAVAAAAAAPAVSDAGQVAVAHWMAQGARDAGLPGELPVMAALTESGLRNLAYGDRDSVGYFQMRAGIWDSGPYAGYLARPELQLRWFLDHALAVRAARLVAGDVAFGTDPAAWGQWIADVERPAEPYRGRYQGQLEAARALLATPAPALAPFELALTVDGTPPEVAGPADDPLAAQVVADARITLSANARADLLAGRIDPRLEAVLLSAAERAPIAISVLQTGHPYLTVNGSVSNHSFGRAADIATVDGTPVGPGNAAARDLALALGELQAPIRPTEIGSPWQIDDPAYFTDADHQDHLHVGFDDPAADASDASAAATAATAAAATVALAPAAPVAVRPGLEPAEPSFRAAGGGGHDRSGAGAPSEPHFSAVEVTP